MEIPKDFTIEALPEYRLKVYEQLEPADPALAKRAQYEGYEKEVDNIGSLTETFASIELHSKDPRWQGVPLRLTTGKNLNEKRSYTTVTYRDGTTDTFEEGVSADGKRVPDAYERVLIEAMNGRKSIFTTSPEVLRAWEIVTSIQQAWELDDAPLSLYVPGSPLSDL
jgi:glucose-6-phosphate 1-dehydrogenase